MVALVVLVSATSARADGLYYFEGVGGTKVHDELSAYMTDAVNIRVGVGMRRREWAYELFLAGHINSALDYENTSDLMTGGLNIKYIQPVASHLEVYLRGSASLGAGSQALEGWSGRGLGAGAGIQLKGKGSVLGLLWWPLFFTNVGPKMTAALWLDTGYEFYRLHGDRPSAPKNSEAGLRPASAVDAQLSTVTLGFALGSDF
jgi:hypothetical protein